MLFRLFFLSNVLSLERFDVRKLKILFTSWHFYLDSSNGAATSTLELLKALAAAGYEVTTFCGAIVDCFGRSSVEEILEKRRFKNLHYEECQLYSIRSFQHDLINSLVFCSNEASVIPSLQYGNAFLNLLEDAVQHLCPDVVITYGGFWMGTKILEIAKRHGAKTVVLLQNFEYTDRTYFKNVDLTIVPSQFSVDWYRRALKIETVSIPPLIDWRMLRSKEKTPRDSLLFVNPSRHKGVFLFARIVEMLQKRRPDIPSLVVEGSGGWSELNEALRHLKHSNSDYPNMKIAKNTPSSSAFYRYAKITLVPSLFKESFGRVPAESLIWGTPVVASNLGALPETLGDAAVLLDVPSKYTENTSEIPSEEETKPWIEAIVNLWDNPDLYDEMCRKGWKHAKRWEYSRVAEMYVKCLESIVKK